MDLRVMLTTTAFAASTPKSRFVGLDCPFTLVINVRVSAIQSLHLPKVSFRLGSGLSC
jgi:hypothetical protein